MKLQLLLINKNTDTTYYSVHVVSNTNATYIYYLICKEEENIYNKVLELLKTKVFHDKMIDKGFTPEDYNEFDFNIITISDYE